eukprot:jgi/Ulvmu1/12379/UM009_0025.1
MPTVSSGALTFSGGSQFLQISLPVLPVPLRSSTGFSAVFTFRLTSMPGAADSTLLLLAGTTHTVRVKVAAGTQVLQFEVAVGGSTTYRVSSAAAAVSLATWHTAVVRYERQTYAMRVWLAGTDSTQANIAGLIGAAGGFDDFDATAAYIGGGPSENGVDGSIRYLLVLQRALSDAEIAALSSTLAGTGAICSSIPIDSRIPTHTAATAAEYMHCPQVGPQGVDTQGTAAPTRTTDSPSADPVFQFGASGEQHIDLQPLTYQMFTRGGFTLVVSLKFDATPGSADHMVFITLRAAVHQRVIMYTRSSDGHLVLLLCGTSTCVTVTSEAAVPGYQWVTIAARYVVATSRIEIWLDGEVVSWADTLLYRSDVAALTPGDLAMDGPIGAFRSSGSMVYQLPLMGRMRHYTIYDGALTDAQMHTAFEAHSSIDSICSHARPHGAPACCLPACCLPAACLLPACCLPAACLLPAILNGATLMAAQEPP